MGATNVYIGDVSPAFDHRLRRAEREIEALKHAVVSLRREDIEMASIIEDLEAQAERQTTVSAGLRVLYDKVAQALKDAGITDGRIAAVIAKMKADADADEERLLANTPEEPPADPVPAPAPTTS